MCGTTGPSSWGGPSLSLGPAEDNEDNGWCSIGVLLAILLVLVGDQGHIGGVCPAEDTHKSRNHRLGKKNTQKCVVGGFFFKKGTECLVLLKKEPCDSVCVGFPSTQKPG